MTFKEGVPEDTLANDMWQLMPVIDMITLIYCHRFAIVTSTTDGKHKKGSKHYKGLAVDLRTRDLTDEQITSYFNALKLALIRLCDVVKETDHIHVEFEPVLYK